MKHIAIRNGYSNQFTKPRNTTLLTAVSYRFFLSPLGMLIPITLVILILFLTFQSLFIMVINKLKSR